MRLLYITVHEPLQYDEISLFEELGAIVDVGNKLGTRPGPNQMRPDRGRRVAWDEQSIKQYDMIVVMHDWAAFQRIYASRSPGQRIVWRTIGQSNPRHERNMATLVDAEIIRYSPKERLSAVYAGETDVIRFYKDETLLGGWTGGHGISMLASRFGRRGMPDHDVISAALSSFEWSLWGNNAGHPKAAGLLEADQITPMMRKSDAFVAAHSVPASYTLNLIEALMVGAPVISVGRSVIRQNADAIPDAPRHALDMFEVDEILEYGNCGILIDSAEDGRNKIKRLLESRALAEELSAAGRNRAIQLFSKKNIKEKWRSFMGL